MLKKRTMFFILLSIFFIVMVILRNRSDELPNLDPEFPAVTGKNLQGKQFVFPRDFRSARVLIIFGYEREQAALLSSWVIGLDLANRDWEWYEMPVISAPLILGSWFIDGGMRKGIPDIRLQERVITLYTDREKFSNSLGIPFNIQGVYAVVVDQKGKLLGYIQGGYTVEGAQQIERWMKTPK
ncbi:hypothetical protein EBR78_07885 [bacterium]|nr:hypothetical protein [bacterium]